MFAGIIETISPVQTAAMGLDVIRINIKKPSEFNDLNIGDSLAVDGVCLTVEKVGAETIEVAIGPETLKVTGWTVDGVKNKVVNLERSLRLNDRIHGHLVTGHVDTTSVVTVCERMGETLNLKVAVPEPLKALIWPKGSVAVNGVSLTINQVESGEFSVGVIPETLKRTNLGALNVGSRVNIEGDNMARGILHARRMMVEL